jgi:hypothetical protein
MKVSCEAACTVARCLLDVGLLRHAHQYFKFASLVSFGRKTRNGLMCWKLSRHTLEARSVTVQCERSLWAWRFMLAEFIQVGFGARTAVCIVMIDVKVSCLYQL